MDILYFSVFISVLSHLSRPIDESKIVGLCGLHRNYDSGTADTIRQRYPWMARIDNTVITHA